MADRAKQPTEISDAILETAQVTGGIFQDLRNAAEEHSSNIQSGLSGSTGDSSDATNVQQRVAMESEGRSSLRIRMPSAGRRFR